MRLIGLAGRARAGKDTVAEYLANNYGFKQFSFAEHLKNVAEVAGWNGLKDEKGRILLQHLGDTLREYDKDIFIKNLTAKIETYERMVSYALLETRVVISDVRLPSEIEALKNLGASIWYISRSIEGIEKVPAHITETLNPDSFKFDYVFDNSSSFQALYSGVDTAIKEVLNA
jgi:dephospho-CoA kinase